MTDKKILATFRIEPEDWESFKNAATAEGSNASAVIYDFVRWYLAGNRIGEKLNNHSTPNLDEVIDERIEAVLANNLNGVVADLQAQIEDLRGKLPA